MPNPNPDTGDPSQAGPSTQIGASNPAGPPTPSSGATKRFERPSYAIHSPNSPPVTVPLKKAYGIDVDQGPYSGWRIYNSFKKITKDPSTWPDHHTLLQDWHIPHVVENMTCAERKERYPADFDGTGQLRSQRQPRGRAAKHDSKEADNNVVLRYMVYKKYYQLHGDEAANHVMHLVKNAPEQTRGPEIRGKKGWSLGAVALVPDDFVPTHHELRLGTNPARYIVTTNNSAPSAKGVSTSGTSRPPPSRSRTPAAAQTGVGLPNKEKHASPLGDTLKQKDSRHQTLPAVKFSYLDFQKKDYDEFGKVIDRQFSKRSGSQGAPTQNKITKHLDQVVEQLDMEPDPLEVFVNKEILQVPVANMKPETVFTRFEASLRDVVKELADADEARLDALKACDQLYKIFIKEICFLVKNNNEEEDWLIGGLNGIRDCLTVDRRDQIHVQNIMTAHYRTSVLIHILKERHWEERKQLHDRVQKFGLYPENAKFWQQVVDMFDPREKGEPNEFTVLPRALMLPVHKEDFKSTLKAIHAKRYLNHENTEPRSISKALNDFKALAALGLNDNGKRAHTPSEEEPPFKSRCTENNMEVPHQTVRTDDKEAMTKADEEQSSAKELEVSVGEEDATPTDTS